MKIERLAVENIKSFDRLDLDLGDFNVFIGANASGKSNVLHILEFLRDIAASGLRNAVSMQGDVEFLRNVNLCDRQTVVEVGFSRKIGKAIETKGGLLGCTTKSSRYRFEISYQDDSYYVSDDKLDRRLEVVELLREDGDVDEKVIGNGKYSLFSENGRVLSEYEIEEANIEQALLSPLLDPLTQEDGAELDSGESLLSSPIFGYPFYPGAKGFGEVAIYDFDARTQRKAAPITGKLDLEEDGSNVALVLKNLLEDDEKQRRFTNLIQYVLPFVSAVHVERFAGRSLIPTLEETHAPGTPLPASLLSEGTIKVISLLIALCFEDKPVIAFEEPASNLHPQLISRVVEMMEEQSGGEGGKQIFVTTHSPEVIKHAGLENVYLVSRDENGFSTVSKPADKDEVKIFLENEMGLDDLFVQGLLDI